ncbi:MAG: J domain-containing protein [Actinomycetota bacterium]|nr:J domain-containing protein [Actinomycetota bacterium]
MAVSSYYEVLGVAPTATSEEIRRAYRQRARDLHPDRQIDRAEPPQAEPPQAEPTSSLRDMQVLNEAWRVLGDRERRSAYDRVLAGARPERRAAPPTGSRRFGEAAEPLDPVGSDAPGWAVAVARGLPWVAVLAVLGAIFVFTAFAAGGSGGGGRAPSASDLVGSCVRLERGGVVDQVPCEGPSNGRVDLVVARASLCPDEADVVRLAGQESWLCLRDPFAG